MSSLYTPQPAHRALVRCLLRQGDEAEMLAEVLAQWAPPQYVPTPENDQALGETDAQFAAWRSLPTFLDRRARKMEPAERS